MHLRIVKSGLKLLSGLPSVSVCTHVFCLHQMVDGRTSRGHEASRTPPPTLCGSWFMQSAPVSLNVTGNDAPLSSTQTNREKPKSLPTQLIYWSSFHELVLLHGASGFAQILGNFKCCCGSRSFLINAFPKVRRAIKWGKVQLQTAPWYPSKGKAKFQYFSVRGLFFRTLALQRNECPWQQQEWLTSTENNNLKGSLWLVIVLCLQCLCWWCTITWKRWT